MEQPTQQMDWQQGPGLLASMWRYRLLLVVVAINVGVGAFFLSAQQPETYEARSRIFLADPTASAFRDPARRVEDPTRLLRELHRAQSSQVRELAAELAGSGVTASGIAERTVVEGDAEIDLLVVRAKDQNPERAAAIANGVAQAYEQLARAEGDARATAAIEKLAELRTELEGQIVTANEGLRVDPENANLQAQASIAQQQLVALGTRAEQLAVDAALYGSGIDRIDAAEASQRPVSPVPFRDAAAGALLGVMAAAGFAWWRAGRTQAADASEVPATVLNAPLLGEIPVFGPRGSNIPLLSELDGVTAEAYQFVVGAIGFALRDVEGGAVAVITSALPGDGKSATSLNLAFAAARDGRRVVLVDGDERVRGLSMRAGVIGNPGLTDLGANGLDFQACSTTIALPGGGQKLRLVPAGNSAVDPAGFFRTPQFRGAIATIRERADLVVVDTPPLLSVSDTAAIASQADGVILVVNRGTRLSRLRETRDRLELAGVPLLGYVFNRGTARDKRSYYGYGDGLKDRGAGNGLSAIATPASQPAVRRPR